MKRIIKRLYRNNYIAIVLVISLCFSTFGYAYATPGQNSNESNVESSETYSQTHSHASQGESSCYPSEAEKETWKADGSLESRIAFQESLGNDQTSSSLIANALQSESVRPESQLRSNQLPSSTSSEVSMSTTGDAHVLALYVSFPEENGEQAHDFIEDDSLYALQQLIGKSLNQVDDSETAEDTSTQSTEYNNDAYFPYESLHAYYDRSSYGKLDIQGTALAYTAQHNRSYYDNNIDALFAEAILSLDDEIDYNNYDANNDGLIDAVYLHFAGPHTGWGSTWWSNERFYSGISFSDAEADGKKIGGIVTLHQPSNSIDGLSTAIHETGHLLGLPDYYSYYENHVEKDPSYRTGILTFDMMNNNMGDHNAFSKWLLGWIEPDEITRIVTNDSGITLQKGSQEPSFVSADTNNEAFIEQTLQLLASDNKNACGGFIAVSNNESLLDNAGLFSSFYLLEYNGYAGNQRVTYGTNAGTFKEIPSGFRVFRIQADLDNAGTSFTHSNKDNDVHNQLIELVDIDGATQHYQFIGSADSTAADTYGCMLQQGSTVTPEGYPSTNFQENINLGFTGLSFEATETNTAQGTVKISYSPTLKPTLEPTSLVLSLKEERSVSNIDTLELVSNSALVHEYTEESVYLSINGMRKDIYSPSISRNNITVTYSVPPELFTPNGTCELVFPAGYFLIGIQDGEKIYSSEIRVPLTMANVPTFVSLGDYSNAHSSTRTMSELFTCEDGNTRFVTRETNGLFTLCTINPEDSSTVTTQHINGLDITAGYNLSAIPAENNTFILMTIDNQSWKAYWIDSETACVTAQTTLLADTSDINAFAYTDACGKTLLTATLEYDENTWMRYLAFNSYTPANENNITHDSFTVTNVNSISNVAGSEDKLAIAGQDATSGQLITKIIDASELMQRVKTENSTTISFHELSASCTLDISTYSGLGALSETADGYLGLAYIEPAAAGSPDLNLESNNRDAKNDAGESVVALQNSTDVKNYLILFNQDGSVADKRCVATSARNGITRYSIIVSKSGSIAVNLDVDTNAIGSTNGRVVMLFEKNLHSNPEIFANEYPSSGTWLQTGAWIETSWNTMASSVYAETSSVAQDTTTDAINQQNNDYCHVHYLVTHTFAHDTNQDNENGDATENENKDTPANNSEDNTNSQAATTLAHTGDTTMTAVATCILLALISSSAMYSTRKNSTNKKR